MPRRFDLLRYALAFALAVVAGCVLATPFQPNANASNAASNTATASPNVSVSVPGGSAAGTQKPAVAGDKRTTPPASQPAV